MKYFINFIKIILHINLINNQLLLSSLVFKTNYKDEFWENSWQEMKPIILKDHDLNWEDWETIKKAISSEVQDVAWRFSDNEEIYDKLGYFYSERVKNIIKVFLERDKKELELKFLYYPNIEKQQIIDKMQNLSLSNVTVIYDEKLIEDKEFLKNELYRRVNEKIIVNKENIAISKTRFKWVRTEQDKNNSELYTVYFNYFNNKPLVPLKVLLLKFKEDEEFPEEVFEINQDNRSINLKSWYINIFSPILTIAIIYGLSIFKLSNLGIVKFINNALNFLSSFRIHVLKEFQSGLIIEQVIDDSMEFSNVSAELTKLLPRTSWQLDTTTATTVARESSVRLLVKQEVDFWKQSVSKLLNQINNKAGILNEYSDDYLVFFNFIKKLEDEEIFHNMEFLEWSNLDPYRIGKIWFNNYKFEIFFPLKNPKFVKPKWDMIKEFKVYISKKLENIIFSRKKIKIISKFELIKLIESYLLIKPNLFSFENQEYKFSIDGFWIEKFEINDKLTIYLNHLLFGNALKIDLELF